MQYQGSKRMLAPKILQYMPARFSRLIEPFAGVAAISIAAAYDHRTSNFHINDLNEPLVRLLQSAVEHPQELIEAYSELWKEQFSYGDDHVRHFFAVREKFNSGAETPENMLYLLARCVKGAVRYGMNGKFNQSPDKRRHGTNPRTLASNVLAISGLMKGRTSFSAIDYRDILEMARPGDLVYMDPPYQGVSNVQNNRYFAGVPFDEFAGSVEMLDRKGVDYLISYDGTCGGKQYGKELPSSLHCKKVMLDAGLSSQAVLLGKKSTTLEALYVSSSLLPGC